MCTTPHTGTPGVWGLAITWCAAPSRTWGSRSGTRPRPLGRIARPDTCDPLCLSALAAVDDLGEPAREPFHVILLEGHRKTAIVINRHRRIVEHDGQNGDMTPHCRLDVEPDGAKRHIAHHVDDLLVRGGQLRPHGETET